MVQFSLDKGDGVIVGVGLRKKLEVKSCLVVLSTTYEVEVTPSKLVVPRAELRMGFT